MTINNYNKSHYFNLKAQIGTALNALKTCAPHPDRMSHRGTVFLYAHDLLKPADDNDALMGSLGMEHMLGMAFTDAANDTQTSHQTSGTSFASQLDAGMLKDSVESYMEETAESGKRGKGTYALKPSNTMMQDFNTANDNAYKLSLRAFNTDLPRRIMLEERLATLIQEAETLSAEPTLPSLNAA